MISAVQKGQGPRPAKRTRASQIAGDLRQAILRGELAPGSKVNLDQLRQPFGVSLSPMREAVSRLLADGLVEVEDQRGYRIAPVSAANLAEVTLLRAELECCALKVAIEQADLEWESRILATLHRLTHTERDPARPATLEDWEAAHTAFHTSLISGCGMPLLLNFCTTLHNLNDRYRRMLLPVAAAQDLVQDHARIAEAAVSRQGARAADLLRAHIERTGALLAARLGALPQAGPA